MIQNEELNCSHTVINRILMKKKKKLRVIAHEIVTER